MIEFISNWIEEITIAVIIVSILEMLLPNGNIKKYVKVILGIYIVFAILSPFATKQINANYEAAKKVDELLENGNLFNNTSDKERSNNEATSEKRLNKIYENTFEKELIKTIEKEGFVVYKCKVNGNFNAEEENAGISKINIVIESKKIIKKNETTINDESNIKIEGVNEIQKVEININDSNIIDRTEDINAKDIDTLRKYLSKHFEIDKSIIKIQTR